MIAQTAAPSRIGAPSPAKLGRILVTGLALISLTACATLTGMQASIEAKDLKPDQRVCPTQDELSKFNMAPAADRRQVRDDVINGCVQAVDRKYGEFTDALHRDTTLTNLAIDVFALGLSGGATLAKKGTTQALAAASTFVQGVGTTFNKDVYYQQTLPALEASMETRRSAAYKAIVDKQTADPDASKDGLSSYGPLIDDYQQAGSVYGAIAQLTSTASAAAQTAKDGVTAAQAKQRQAYAVVDLGPAVTARLVKLTSYVRKLVATDKAAKLDPIATKLGVPIVSDFPTEQVSVVDALDSKVNSAADKDAVMTQLETDLSPLMK
jgi:hypothetical protein